MDHRDTGRSKRLACAAESSPSGEVDESNVASTARDIATFMSEYINGKHTIVPGESYGMMVEERLIHLGPPEATGYVLDVIATYSGA
ncbi:hypothetical protein DVH05_006736 [Phytophthora capsici]|nr:hypothetical protein DVH05_010950 [Phytophthora capsici]KAG1703721.1 hypothetical protein DVH05_006736 [Phytophthora capsici]